MSNATKVMFAGMALLPVMLELDKHPNSRLEHRDVQDNDPRIPPGTVLPVRNKDKQQHSPVIIRLGVKDSRATSKRVATRTGKTKRDHASGSWKQRFINREARVQWQQDNRATNDTFPG